EKGGASSVSLVTPQGTNTWHGDGFWFYRTNAWKANDWFNDASGVAKPGLLQNQGGGNIGGPLKKDKLYVYGYYEFQRQRAQRPNDTVVLSPTIQAALSGATPSLPFTYQPVDGTTGQPSGPPVTQDLLNLPNHSPFSIDPAMLQLIKRVPQTSNNNRVGDGVNLFGFQFNARSNTSRDNVGARVDYNLNARNTLSGTWSYNRSYFDRPDIDTSFDTVPKAFNDDHIKFLSTSWQRGNHVLKFGTQLQRVTIFETNSAGIYPDLQLGFSAVNPNTPSQSDFPAPSNALISAADFGNAEALLATTAGILSNISQTFNVTS